MDINQLLFRDATPKDIELIYHFLGQQADALDARDELTISKSTLKKRLFSTDGARLIFAVLDGVEVGFVYCFPLQYAFEEKPGLYLENIHVIDSMRSHGIGRCLIQYLANQAQAQGYARLVGSVDDANLAAIRFYESLGATPIMNKTRYQLDL